MKSQDEVAGDNFSTVDFRMSESEVSQPEDSQPLSILSHRFRESPPKRSDQKLQEKGSPVNGSFMVLVRPPAKPWEYEKQPGDTTVDVVLEEVGGPSGKRRFLIEYEDGSKEEVSEFSFF
jgi:chromodomain-helicase-DNA-binding protein 4